MAIRFTIIQEQLARQSADRGRWRLRRAPLPARRKIKSEKRLPGFQWRFARVSAVALQRSQLEELMQSLSAHATKTRWQTLNRPSGWRQQAQLTGSLDPLVAALEVGQPAHRARRPAAPGALQRAIGRDLDRLTRAAGTGHRRLLGRLDELVRQVDDPPVLNAVAQAVPPRGGARQHPSQPAPPQTWLIPALVASHPAAQLKRCATKPVGWYASAVFDQPEAILLALTRPSSCARKPCLALFNARLGVGIGNTTPACRP